MTDIFEQKILCNKCNVQMKQGIVHKNGLELRAVRCPKCGATVVHPADLNNSERFNDLKGKTFNVKLRMVGNSHAISIPKEIVDFMNETQGEINEQHSRIRKHMDDMVRLCLEDFKSLRLDFGSNEGDLDEDDDSDEREMKQKKARRQFSLGEDR